MDKPGPSSFLRDLYRYFTPGERALWCCSAGAVLTAFILFDRRDYMTLAASLIGVTSLILDAKANPIGQALMVAFSLLYGIISFRCAYYGEMLTYLGMTAPMSVFALASWLRHPFEGDRSQVQVRRLRPRDGALMLLLSGAVTVIFFFVLRAFGTAVALQKKRERFSDNLRKKEGRLSGKINRLNALTFGESAWLFPSIPMLLQDQVFSCSGLRIWYVFQQLRQGAV